MKLFNLIIITTCIMCNMVTSEETTITYENVEYTPISSKGYYYNVEDNKGAKFSFEDTGEENLREETLVFILEVTVDINSLAESTIVYEEIPEKIVIRSKVQANKNIQESETTIEEQEKHLIQKIIPKPKMINGSPPFILKVKDNFYRPILGILQLDNDLTVTFKYSPEYILSIPKGYDLNDCKQLTLLFVQSQPYLKYLYEFGLYKNPKNEEDIFNLNEFIDIRPDIDKNIPNER